MDLAEVQNMVGVKEGTLSRLRNRMDGDKDLYYLKPYEMLDNKRPMTGVDNVTSNEPAVFANQVISNILSANQQRVVEGEGVKPKQTVLIEEFLRDIEYEIDQILLNQNEFGLFPFAAEKMCIRGSSAERVTLYKKDGELRLDGVLPIDTRYLSYEVDRKGLVWAAYHTNRTKEMILSEYDVKVEGDNNDSCDFWSREENWVWTGTKKLHWEKNKYRDLNGEPYVPFVIQGAPLGSGLKDSDAPEHKNESIYMLNRGIYPELHKTATILQTLNRLAMRPGMQWENPEGVLGEIPEGNPYISGEVTAVAQGMGYKPVPITDVIAATRLWYSMLMNALQKGSLPSVDYGNLTFPLPAVAILTLMATRDRVYAPRFQALAQLQQKRSKMLITQLIKMGGAIELGEEGHRKAYHATELKGAYTIKYKYFSKSPMEEAASYAVANQAKDYLPDRMILEKIIKVEDPEGTMQERRAEKAEQLSPVIALYRHAHSLVDQADNNDDEQKRMEAEIITEQGVNLLRQQRMGQMPELPEGEKTPAHKELMPMFGGGGTGRRITPEMEGGEE